MTCFQYLKNDVFVWISTTKCQYDNENQLGFWNPNKQIQVIDATVFEKKTKCQYLYASKNNNIEDDLVFVYRNSRINDTHSQGY